jgi:hypothetical protein
VHRHLRHSLMLLFFLSYCCGASGTEVSSFDTSLDARVRTALDIPNEEPLNEGRFRDAVLKRFPVGAGWTEVEGKIRTLVSPHVKPDPRGASIFLYDRERLIYCELARDVRFMGCSFFSDPALSAISLNDRTWHFQIRFDGKKKLEQVHTNLTSTPCWQDPNRRSEACIRNAIEDCQSKGGIWYGHLSGRGRNTGCNLPTTDAGRPCTNRTQCQGACVPAPISDTSGAGCTCDRWMMLPKGEATLCTEKGLQRIHFE